MRLRRTNYFVCRVQAFSLIHLTLTWHETFFDDFHPENLFNV